MALDTTLLATAAATFLLAGLVKGLIGLGLPTVSVAVLSATAGLPLAVPLMVVPSVVTNFWQAVDGPATAALVRRFRALLAASVAGVFVAYSLLFVGNARMMTALLGLVLLVHGSAGLCSIVLFPRVRREALASPAVGLVTGVLAGATGSMVLPVVAYFQRLELPRDELIQMMGISFTVSTAAIGLASASHGNFELDLLAVSTLCLVPAVAGMWLGQRLRRRVSELLFRRLVNAGLVGIALHLIWKGWPLTG